MPKIYVISDTHFGHENIIKYAGRSRFSSAKEMDAYMKDQWNSVVTPQDKVYHLGDVYFNGSYNETPYYWLDFLGSLNGKKRLILGNHDNGKDQVLQKVFQKIGLWRYFKKEGLLLTHVPIHKSSFISGDPKGTNTRVATCNVHGHTHDNGSPTGPYKSACVELIDYTPVPLESFM